MMPFNSFFAMPLPFVFPSASNGHAKTAWQNAGNWKLFFNKMMMCILSRANQKTFSYIRGKAPSPPPSQFSFAKKGTTSAPWFSAFWLWKHLWGSCVGPFLSPFCLRSLRVKNGTRERTFARAGAQRTNSTKKGSPTEALVQVFVLPETTTHCIAEMKKHWEERTWVEGIFSSVKALFCASYCALETQQWIKRKMHALYLFNLASWLKAIW